MDMLPSEPVLRPVFSAEQIFDFIRISSFCGTESTGGINLALEHEASLRDKDVLIVEDIMEQQQHGRSSL